MYIKFFLIMTVSSYFQFAKAQSKALTAKDGIIIYWSENKETPMYILFIPAVLDKNESFNECLLRILSNKETLTYIVYFQPIRWIQPDVGSVISSLKFVNATYGPQYKPIKISYGRITFDNSHTGDPEIEEDTSITETKLVYKDLDFILNVSEWPRLFGTPKIFERTNIIPSSD